MAVSQNDGNDKFPPSLLILFPLALLGQSFAIVFVKLAGMEDMPSRGFFLYLICALAVMVLYAVMWQLLLERIALTRAYMFRGVVYILILVWSVLIFKETVTLQNIIGSGIIIAGVAINAYSD
ncbi:MAG: EamA family transporter [Clostridiales Family XIII bacterium]|jgi:drug/metabolite transporter (DMT)-like permease|nr:EamA family transporter [Clostridiales Family XIII bacterium]